MAVSRLILASSSPRRFDLLKEAGFNFEVIMPDVEENEDGSIPIRKLTEMNARLKAEAVARHHPDAVVVAEKKRIGNRQGKGSTVVLRVS